MANAFILPPAETQFSDANGAPLAGGSVYLYVPGTTTAKTTWQDAGQVTANPNPVILDAAGRALICGDGQYRQVVYDASGNLIWDQVTGYAPTTTTSSGRVIPTATGGLVQGGFVVVPATIGSITLSFPVAFSASPESAVAVIAQTGPFESVVVVSALVVGASSMEIFSYSSTTGEPVSFSVGVYWMAIGPA